MAIERTFSIIKPNAVAKTSLVISLRALKLQGSKLSALKMLHLTVERARGFMLNTMGKPFFDGLVEFMTSGPIVVSRAGR